MKTRNNKMLKKKEKVRREKSRDSLNIKDLFLEVSRKEGALLHRKVGPKSESTDHRGSSTS